MRPWRVLRLLPSRPVQRSLPDPRRARLRRASETAGRVPA
ncbi:hypothetical protein 2204_scaffold812_00036 [Bacteriophage sp.]|nr:hypothetical protein 2204_scaffold812_00036 [Bacteriophage sp.]